MSTFAQEAFNADCMQQSETKGHGAADETGRKDAAADRSSTGSCTLPFRTTVTDPKTSRSHTRKLQSQVSPSTNAAASTPTPQRHSPAPPWSIGHGKYCTRCLALCRHARPDQLHTKKSHVCKPATLAKSSDASSGCWRVVGYQEWLWTESSPPVLGTDHRWYGGRGTKITVCESLNLEPFFFFWWVPMGARAPVANTMPLPCSLDLSVLLCKVRASFCSVLCRR